MRYIDIHTHKSTISCRDNEIAIYNREDSDWNELSPSALYSVGIHPWHITDDWKTKLSCIRKEAERGNVIMLGETGFDKLIPVPLSLQSEIFLEHVNLSEAVKKPLIIHCVKAWTELLEVHHRIRPVMPWVVHGFRGKGELAKQLIRKGIYLSFGEHFNKQALMTAWPDCLFVETDESASDISRIYEHISESLNLPPMVVRDQVEQNFITLFMSNEAVQARLSIN